MPIFTARKRSLGQGNIFIGVCQKFCSRGGCLPQCMLGYTPPGSRHPPEQTCPPFEQTPPQEQTPLPSGADTPQEQTPPPGSRHPPEQTPPGADIPPPRADTPLQRRACLEIRSMRGRYASNWNAILFNEMWFKGWNPATYLYVLISVKDVAAVTATFPHLSSILKSCFWFKFKLGKLTFFHMGKLNLWLLDRTVKLKSILKF